VVLQFYACFIDYPCGRGYTNFCLSILMLVHGPVLLDSVLVLRFGSVVVRVGELSNRLPDGNRLYRDKDAKI
jgi:hypothetical protein